MYQFNSVTFYGEAQETGGLTVSGAIDGIGLVTYGFLWECPYIWSTVLDTPTTTWTNSTSPSFGEC